MKKKYIKPTVYVESFELSQHIASCGTRGENGVVVKNSLINEGCNITGNDWTGVDITGNFFTAIKDTKCYIDNEMYCYTNNAPVTEGVLFSS